MLRLLLKTTSRCFTSYRRFTILVSYDPEAFQRSHRIEFFLPQERQTPERDAQSQAVIDSVACLKRTDSSRCANCIGQQKAGKRRVGDHDQSYRASLLVGAPQSQQ
jgi:hypothetical protein